MRSKKQLFSDTFKFLRRQVELLKLSDGKVSILKQLNLGDVETGVTAATASNQAGGHPVTHAVTVVSTSGTAGDSLTLQAGDIGDVFIVINNAAANAIDVFPQSGAAIDAGSSNAAVSIAAAKRRIFIRLSSTLWASISVVA